eukprot:4224235-Lingulodinium_polyedra.AAC.1
MRYAINPQRGAKIVPVLERPPEPFELLRAHVTVRLGDDPPTLPAAGLVEVADPFPVKVERFGADGFQEEERGAKNHPRLPPGRE